MKIKGVNRYFIWRNGDMVQVYRLLYVGEVSTNDKPKSLSQIGGGSAVVNIAKLLSKLFRANGEFRPNIYPLCGRTQI